MFTGIVEELGQARALELHNESARLSVTASAVSADLEHGDSIAVDGVCLTVTEASPGEGFTADVMAETLAHSTLGAVQPAQPVNLERPVRPSDRLGGHIVQGHADGVGTVVSRHHADRWDVVRVAVPTQLSRYVVHKGSLALDGVSLTISAVEDDQVEVSLIPTTLQTTTLGGREPGEKVNVEIDVLAKYVTSLLGKAGA